MSLPHLPIQEIIPALQRALAAGPAVLAAPPGSGKTTIVPLALLDEPWMTGKKILLLEPRRLAARAAAARMAKLRGEMVGQTVGYHIRFDRRIARTTRIEVLTEGILTRRLQTDAALADVGLIIFDEFHERSIHADLALALCLDLCQIKEDLRLLVMSATLDAAPVAKLLGDVPIITGEGRQHEVRIDYLECEPRGRIGTIVARGIGRVLREQQGDILAFLPGAGEIRETQRILRDDPACNGLVLAPLFGDLGQSEQDQAMLPDPDGRRRIILATAIAETSLTIEGVRCVVDGGWSRLPSFNPGNGLSALTTVQVSKAAAQQRAGRAGRLGPGYCLRLWTRHSHHSLPLFHPPEIFSVDLGSLVLELALWGITDPGELHWLDPPRSGPYQQGRELLQQLEALDEEGRITTTGRQLAALPLHPRLGHMLLKAHPLGQTSVACDLAALLSERDLLRRDSSANTSASLGVRLQLLDCWRRYGDSQVSLEGGDPVLCHRVDQSARHWLRLLGSSSRQSKSALIDTLLLYAYPDRIARRRPGQRVRYLLTSGRGACLVSTDPLAASEYLIVPHLDAGQREGRIFLAASLNMETVCRHHGHLLTTSKHIDWDDGAAKVVAVRRVSLGNLVIEESALAEVNPVDTRLALLRGIERMGLHCLPWDREARQFQARVHCLRIWNGAADWPDLRDEALAKDLSWLKPALGTISKAAQLGSIKLVTLFNDLLGWERQQQLARDAPIALLVPSGSKIRIEYQIGQSPVLAVRIQEMFGRSATPAICGGAVPLVLHLLSPARRPIQITSDLAGFWQRGYPEVKKQLKGRYPKHDWPDDPCMAEPLRGVKRKK